MKIITSDIKFTAVTSANILLPPPCSPDCPQRGKDSSPLCFINNKHPLQTGSICCMMLVVFFALYMHDVCGSSGENTSLSRGQKPWRKRNTQTGHMLEDGDAVVRKELRWSRGREGQSGPRRVPPGSATLHNFRPPHITARRDRNVNCTTGRLPTGCNGATTN